MDSNSLRLLLFAATISASSAIFFLPTHHHHHHKQKQDNNETLSQNHSNAISIPPPPSILFYSFFIAMEKSEGYALPFANKLCFMAKHGYSYLLDVIPMDQVPIRAGHKAPTWYKPPAVVRWLKHADYLVYLDMDLVVKRNDVDFTEQYILPRVLNNVVPDLVVTDHNRCLNNGAFVLKNSAWGNRFAARWAKISKSGFRFPFSDNGSFIETLLSFLPNYGTQSIGGGDSSSSSSSSSRHLSKVSSTKVRFSKQQGSPARHPCMHPGARSTQFLDCAIKHLDAAIGKFTGTADRVLVTPDGGVVRFVNPKWGFNSHEWNQKRPNQGWHRKACFNDDTGFILHTKEWAKEVPVGSASCSAATKAAARTRGSRTTTAAAAATTTATARAAAIGGGGGSGTGSVLETKPGQHLYGAWGHCDLLAAGARGRACHENFPGWSSAYRNATSTAADADATTAAAAAAAAAAAEVSKTEKAMKKKRKKEHHSALGSALAFSFSSSSSPSKAGRDTADSTTTTTTTTTTTAPVKTAAEAQPTIDERTAAWPTLRAPPLPPPTDPPPVVSLLSPRNNSTALAPIPLTLLLPQNRSLPSSSPLSLSSMERFGNHTSAALTSSAASSSTSSTLLPLQPPPPPPPPPPLLSRPPPSPHAEPEKCLALRPLSEVPTMRRGAASGDHYGAIAVPKTATTSLTKLMLDAGLSSACGGVLWSFSGSGHSSSSSSSSSSSRSSSGGAHSVHRCPRGTTAAVKLMPYDFQYEVAGGAHKGEAKEFKHLLHADYAEIQQHWAAARKGFAAAGAPPPPQPESQLQPRLFTVVVLREPVSRLYSAYVHGKQMVLRNQINPRDTAKVRQAESTRQRMAKWRHFYWSYRDYNDTVLHMADRAGQRGGGFEAFAAIAQLPTHNQQTRMVAGADLRNRLPGAPQAAPPAGVVGSPSTQATLLHTSSSSADSNDPGSSHGGGSLREVLERAKANLCRLDCVGVLEDLDPLVRCVSKQLVGVAKSAAGSKTSKSSKKKNGHNAASTTSTTATTTTSIRDRGGGWPQGLRLESSNSIQKHKAQGGVTTTEAISAAARSTVMRISWADAELHAFAKDLVARRLD